MDVVRVNELVDVLCRPIQPLVTISHMVLKTWLAKTELPLCLQDTPKQCFPEEHIF